MKLESLSFVSSNAHKVAEVAAILGREIKQVSVELPELQSLDVTEVVRAKAEAAFAQVQQPVIVEDTSLQIIGLQGLPGPLVKWFLSTIGDKGLAQFCNQSQDRKAAAQSCFGLITAPGKVQIFLGEVAGKIAAQPRGTNGFGWDTIFIPDGQTLTFAELGTAEKNKLSHRFLALQKLKTVLYDCHLSTI